MVYSRRVLHAVLTFSLPWNIFAVTHPIDTLADRVEAELIEKIALHRDAFRSWMQEFEKTYDSLDDELKRMMTWIKNDEYIKLHNGRQYPKPSYTLGHNHFSDLSNEEFRELNFLGEFSTDVGHYPNILELEPPLDDVSVLRRLKNIPSHIDWVKKGAVTTPKNQGQCGACWAFSTAGSLEGASFIQTGDLVDLSVQMLIDCDHIDKACAGGLMLNAYKFDAIEGGLCLSEDYPYVGHDDGVCKDKTCEKVPKTTVKTFKSLKPGNVGAMKAALAQQPVSIAMHAADLDFQLYRSGVYNNPMCGTKLDHGVLAVGYGTDEESQLGFWKIKNSWGAKWGENGFFRINSEVERGTDGMCGVLSNLSVYPILA